MTAVGADFAALSDAYDDMDDLDPARPPAGGGSATRPADLAWHTLPAAARTFVVLVILSGIGAVIAVFPRTAPDPALFLFVLLAACLTSAWKVNLPIPLSSGSTLSVSCAADVMALLLLGPGLAVIIAAIGVWIQCTVNVRQRYPLYRTVFSTAAEALAMAATGVAYMTLGGTTGPFDIPSLTRPLVGAIAVYFVANTGLVAAAIALSTGRRLWTVWRRDFMWSAASYMVAGSAGAIAAVVIQRGDHWVAVLMLAPIYLVYRTYRLFVGRLEDEKRHMAEIARMHRETVAALRQASQAEQDLAKEKESLAIALAEMTRLEEARVHLLEREQAARASAEAANRIKDQFLATVSHELRTPLNAILGWAEMLRVGMLEGQKRERACEAIFNNARRQARLIDELLDVARIMSGKLRIERTVVNVKDIVDGALETMQPAAEAKGIRIGVDIDPAVGAFRGDGPRLQQVLWNLLTNALKFTPTGGSIDLRVRRVGNVGEIVVSDSGAGIPRDFLPSVFEPFRQADGSPTRLHGGLGLGLAIVRQLVEAHGGSITVDSAGEGLGATFTVRLPLAVPVERRRRARTRVPLSETVRSGSTLERVTVLVVDDEDESRGVVAAWLETQQARVLTAGSASEALDILQRERVDVLLADIAMPGEDGYALVRKVRALPDPRVASTPAAALTAFAREEDRQEALRAGFQMHLTKPIDAASLIAAVASLRQVASA
ncbi:MAG TPA: ATP-binding protein [Vicinamibacterales bacterium]|nr:ATP-binding protein [Vicinamibacterales bacterium]